MKRKLLLILFVALLSLSACGKKTDDGGDGSKVLHIAKDTAVRTLDNSLATDGMSFEVMENFIDGLIDYDADGKIIPRLAKTWDEDDQGTSYTFHLRDDATWSNGDPVTAHDFVYAWQRVVDPTTNAEYAILFVDAGILNAEEVTAGDLPVEELGVKALDDFTLEVKLSDTVPYFLEFLTFPIFNPLNEAFVTQEGDKYAKSPEGLLSNGPFVLTDWVPGSSLSFKKNNDYVDADDVALDGIEYKILSDYQTAALEFDNGSIDYAKISSDLISRYVDGEAYQQVPSGFTWYISPNQDNQEIDNDDLRLALAYAIDRHHIVDEIMGDGSIAAEFIVPVGLATGPDGKDFRETSKKFLEYDVDKAKEHLEKAKTALGKDSFEFELIIEDSEESRTNAEAIQSDLNALEGVEITITTVPKNERLDRMKAGDFELGLTRWGPDYADPYTYLGTLFPTGANYNQANYSNADYDALIEKLGVGGSLSQDPEARWEAFKDAEAILLDEAGVIPVWQSSEAVIINPKVKGIEMHVVGMTSYRNVTIED